MYRTYFKPVFDFIICLLGLIVVSPVFVIITMFLFISNSGHPFFLQNRPGKRGKLFKIIKFKTMNDRRDPHGQLLPDEQRLTTIGRLIRNTSLDELPQIINVLKGDMSLIGPRPLLTDYLRLYNAEQARRMEVKPGLTGWAQVNGRNSISWSKRFEFDVFYVDNISFMLDMKILVRTIKKVIMSEGIASGTSQTMERFTGNN